ncbi:hypothetical protein BGZ83_011145 [Gryganskiella cystojenkinii]|nr:hypothetical protein BGZ83_011145 [Gryganskiella cystojenkinii]
MSRNNGENLSRSPLNNNKTVENMSTLGQIHSSFRNYYIILSLSSTSRLFVPVSVSTKHAPMIRKLVMWCYGSFKFPVARLSCPNLVEIELGDRGSITYEKNLITLIKNHQSTLKTFLWPSDVSLQVAQALAGCLNLERLSLGDLKYNISNEQWMRLYEDLWSRLQVLSWNGLEHDPDIDQPVDDTSFVNNNLFVDFESGPLSRTKTSSIEELCLISDPRSGGTGTLLRWHLVLLLKSPRLRRLKSNIGREDNGLLQWLVKVNQYRAAATTTATTTEVGTETRSFIPHVESLSLYGGVLTNLDLIAVIRSLPLLTELELRAIYFHYQRGDPWGELLFEALPNRLTTFRVLKLQGCSQVNGRLVQEIMCSMPGLEVLTANYITDSDILNDNRPWICSGLQELCLAFTLFEQDSRTKERAGAMFLSRLSNLTELRGLDLSMHSLVHSTDRRIRALLRPSASQYSGRTPFENLQRNHGLRLEHETGLDQLHHLKKLESIKWPRCGEVWKEAEARWVLKHWRRLRCLDGVCLDETAKRLLGSRVACQTDP